MARLDARPEARTFSVEQLLALVLRGAIRNPDFQRAVHWKRRNVLDLFDSIYQGFPVGNLLLSKRQMPAAELAFGPLHLRANAVPDAFLVVDGQQRIQALAGALLHPDPSPRGGAHGVWFDLETEAFFVPTRSQPQPTCVPLNVVGSSAKLGRWVSTHNLIGVRDDLADRAFELGARIREFQLPAYVLENASEPALRQVFRRANVSGVQMKEAEVFDALFATPAGKPVALACARLADETTFGALDESVFLRCLKMVGGNIKESLDSLDVEDGPAQLERVSATRAALARTIRLLTEDAQIPHVKLLPYQLPLLVLPRFFHVYPDPSPKARTLLVRWVWRGILSFSHGDNSEAVLGRILKAGQGSAEAWALALLRSIEGELDLPSSGEEWNPGARLDACLIALCALPATVRPPTGRDALLRDFQDGLLERLESGQLGKAFPDAFLPAHSTVARALAASREEVSELPGASADVLAMHGIDEAAREAWLHGDEKAFADARVAILDHHFTSFFTAVTGPRDDDRLSVGELVRQADAALAAP